MTTPTLPPEIAAALQDNRLNTLHRNQRVAALIAEREKALVEALKAAARNLWNSGTAYSCQGTLTAAKEADAMVKSGALSNLNYDRNRHGFSDCDLASCVDREHYIASMRLALTAALNVKEG